MVGDHQGWFSISIESELKLDTWFFRTQATSGIETNANKAQHSLTRIMDIIKMVLRLLEYYIYKLYNSIIGVKFVLNSQPKTLRINGVKLSKILNTLHHISSLFDTDRKNHFRRLTRLQNLSEQPSVSSDLRTCQNMHHYEEVLNNPANSKRRFNSVQPKITFPIHQFARSKVIALG